MNVSKIQMLSEQHKFFVRFHLACNLDNVELTVVTPGHRHDDVTLDKATTKLIILDVRVSTLKRISEIENEIRKAVGV